VLVGPENRGKLDRIVQLTVRMDSLLDSLLYFSHIGGGDAAPQAVDLNKTVTQALEMVGFRTYQASLLHMPRVLPTTFGNETQCRQIFVNLLSNALKYSNKPQKRIEIGYIDPAETHPRPGWRLSANCWGSTVARHGSIRCRGRARLFISPCRARPPQPMQALTKRRRRHDRSTLCFGANSL